MDVSVYLIASMSYGIEKIEEALAAGVTMVQLREKNITTRKYFEVASKIKVLTKKYQVPLIINDRLDLAMAVGADGVHLGQNDLPVEQARRIAGKSFIIGATAKTLETALEAENLGANYVGSGAFFATQTKQDATAIDYAVYKVIKSQIHIPSVAIGGINESNYNIPINLGADGIAMGEGLLNATHIGNYIRNIKKELRR